MGKYLTALMLLCQTAAFADWLPGGQPIPEGASTAVDYDVYTVYNEANQTVVATWGDYDADENVFPFYAVFDGTTWTTPGTAIPPGTSAGVYHNIIPVYNADTQTVVAVWSDSDSFIPYYAVFDGTTWTTPGTIIPVGASTGIYTDIFAAYNPNDQTVVAAWGDANTQLPYYAIFDGATWTTPGTAIPPGTSNGALNNINLIYNAANQTIVGTWADSVTNQPYYAVFDGTTWTTPGTLIPPGFSNGSGYDVTLVYNPSNQTVVAAWGDSVNDLPYYSVFDGTTWTTTGSIPQGSSTGVYQNVSLTYDGASGTLMAAWSDATNYLPFYSIFNGTSWTQAASVPVTPSVGIDYDIILTFIPSTGQIIATWANYPGDTDPYFNLFASLAPPGALIGDGCRLSFASQAVWINQLYWAPSTSSDVVAYNIYRDGVLIASVSADTFQYNDAVRIRGPVVYGVTAVSSSGTESAPITITLISRGR